MRRLIFLLVLPALACGRLSTPLPPAPPPAPVAGTITTTPSGSVIASLTVKPPTTAPSNAAVFPDPSAYQWQSIASGLNRPLDIQNTGDGSGRLFIVEKPGRIRIFKNGQLLETPFLDITDRVGSSGNEQGLLSLAFHPHYAENGRFFVNYTDNNGNTVIARFQASADFSDPNSEVDLLHVNQPFPNHNGGAVVFGPDGYLYLGLGDGGSQGDPSRNGQNLKTLLGKILRIDVDHGDPYSIPSDNPFAASGGSPEVWAYGLRNPWRFSFDKATSDLFIGDVGQDKWEEIDYYLHGAPGGANFGWSILEGTHPYNGSAQPGLVMPVAEYGHDQGCAVTGGYVYRGSMPEWQGIYLYGDYCKGRIWGLIKSESGFKSQVLFDAAVTITSFGQDESGEVYLASDNGNVYVLKRK
jgi:glucose/arabinose dehydrogenase